jgi:hypothetical protein
MKGKSSASEIAIGCLPVFSCGPVTYHSMSKLLGNETELGGIGRGGAVRVAVDRGILGGSIEYRKCEIASIHCATETMSQGKAE